MAGHRRIATLLAVLAASLLPGARAAAASVSGPASRAAGDRVVEAADDRIRFVVSASEVDLGASTLLYEAAIEGPEGTDFDLLLKGSRFRMTARFLTDRTGPDELRVRATLEARRLYGTSERGLPLWEEDARQHDLRLPLDQDLVLLPFGGPEAEPRLEVRIRPARVPGPGSGKLDIDIRQQSTDNSVSVQARWRPHHYRARAVLLAGDAPVARGAADCLLQEPSRLSLEPTGMGGMTEALRLDLDVVGFQRGRPDDQVEIRFDVTTGDGRALAREWAGVAAVGAPLEYDLPGIPGATTEVDHVLRIEVEPVEVPASD